MFAFRVWLLVVFLSSFLILGCGGGSSSSSSLGELSGAHSGGQQPGPTPGEPLPGSARLAIQTSLPLLAQEVSRGPIEAQGLGRLLSWFSSPAWAQTGFFTLPGARVDALGFTFALADSQGVAEFFFLPPGPYQILVSTSNPAVSLTRWINVQSGQQLQATVDEFATMAALMASGPGADFEALQSVFQSGVEPAYQTVRTLVEDLLQGDQAWLDPGTGRPSDPVLVQAIAAARDSRVFVADQIPYQGFPSYPTQPLLLGLDFGGPIDPQSLALQQNAWSLQTPAGTIDASNIDQFGSITYLNSQQEIEGRVWPANSLLIQLNDPGLALGSEVEITLSLGALPTANGQPILSSRPAQDFATWRFIAGGNELPGATVDSNITGSLVLGFNPCHGNTTADLSEFSRPPRFIFGRVSPVLFEFQWHDVDFSLSPVERRYRLLMLSPTSFQVGDVFTVGQVLNEDPDSAPLAEPGFDLTYEELSYLEGPQGFVRLGRWEAVSGEAKVLSMANGRLVIEISDADLQSTEADNDNGFCLTNGRVEAQFP